MIRRLLTNVLENTLQPIHSESTIYHSPFTKLYTSHLSWLTSASPCFSIKADNITILTEPREFYDTLVKNCATASRRITLASLYLGNGGLEQKLVQSLINNQNLIHGKLKINILLDHMRASRYKNNSRTILMPLLERKEENCNVSLYHTPTLRGLRKKFAPHRWNELFGLQHMKLYIFDDTLIISGANLSNDYFTNRQDRYFIIKDKTMCDFYDGLVNKVQQFSLRMDKRNNLVLNFGWNQLPYEGSKAKFVDDASDAIENYLMNWKDDQNVCKREGCGMKFSFYVTNVGHACD